MVIYERQIFIKTIRRNFIDR